MKKPGALASALRDSGATIAAASTETPIPLVQEPSPASLKRSSTVQPSRLETKAITVHMPAEVRRQLKALAAEQDRQIADMVGEALNLLFVKYRKPELASRKAAK